MWTAEIIESNGLSKLYYIKGPKFTIGRNEGVDLAFSTEKSISRSHCEISIISQTNGEASIALKDQNSRFGTFVNDRKLASGETVTCSVSQQLIVRLGVANWRLVLCKRELRLCSTRLEKSEKELLKKRSKLIGASIVQSTDASTHLVTTKATATVKFLTALVSKTLKIVNLSWLEFAETTKSIEVIKGESEFFPESSDDAVLVQPAASRQSIFAPLHILLLHSTDSQYEELFRNCGAIVTELYDLVQELGNNWTDIMARIQLQHHRFAANNGDNSDNNSIVSEANKRKLCVFYDETSCSTSATTATEYLTQLLPLVSTADNALGMVYYITAAITAGSIMELHPPTLLIESPLPTASIQAHASSSSLTSDAIFLEDQHQEQGSSPAVKSETDVGAVSVVEEHVTAKRRGRPPRVAAKSVPDTALPLKQSKDVSEGQGKEMNFLEIDQPFPTTSNATTNSTATKRKRNKDWLMSDDEDEEEQDKKRAVGKESAQKRPRFQPQPFAAVHSDTDNIANDSANHAKEDWNELPDRPSSAATLKNNNSKDLLAVTAAESSSAVVVAEEQRPGAKAKVVVDADEWISIEKRMEAVDIHLPPGEQAADVGVVKPVIVVKRLLDENNMNVSNSISSTSHSASTPSDCNNCYANGVKNVKKFTKNVVRKVEYDERVSLKAAGQKVLPKQSEREIQLRLEYEQTQAKQQLADAMFSDNFGGNANKKGKRKGL